MNDRIAQALSKLFERHRIVFWYDAEQELREDFDALALEGVEKIELANNEYGVKYRILRQEPTQRFLLYRAGPQPSDLENWLLDVQLAQGEFRTDQIGIWLSELELGLAFADLLRSHSEFFQANKRRDALKVLLKPQDTEGQLRVKMLAVCAAAEPRLDTILESLLQELADGRDEKIRLMTRCNLTEFLWEQLARVYGYKPDAQADERSIKDFAIELFKSCYAMDTDGDVKLHADALVFLKRWKDSRQFEDGFETLSAECAEVLGIESDLEKRDFRDVLSLDYFRLIDQKVISDLVREVVAQTVSAADVSVWIRQRRQGHWYREFAHLYEAIDYAASFNQTLNELQLTMNSIAEGVQRYSQAWFKVDQFYRKFIYHMQMSGQASLLKQLAEYIENRYTNSYLLKLGDRFAGLVDAVDEWNASPISKQSRFFEHWVQPFLRKDKKVVVIISDALRYEVCEELLTLIRQEDRYGAELEPMLSMLPSYTQLGMASLLPHKTLALADNESGTVLLDGQSTQGSANRTKILNSALQDRGETMKFDAFMQLDREGSRELFKQNDVLYIYHNRIDHVGDKMQSETQAFEAAQQTLDELVKLVKKLTAANATNLLITADHGFIYQHRPLEESDFSQAEPKGSPIFYRDRRFVLGKNLTPSTSLHTFRSAQLGLAGDVEVQLSKSINRMRLQGSGSRFVHGGATLQEVVVPVLKINKKRQSDTTSVEVDILRGSSSVITSGQLAVTFYQADAVTDKVQPRFLRAGIYTESGQLISDTHQLSFDLISSNPREREQMVRFVLTRQAEEANGKEVILRLEEKHAGTSHFKEYKSLRYLMRRSFTSDFDF
ncbi:MAG: BREX-1 system phosphatase PglZ type A [Thiotrichales bacterium]|nr:BREX-1 system phosphatase PglZ type A [Thiotrichales bacterium]